MLSTGRPAGPRGWYLAGPHTASPEQPDLKHPERAVFFATGGSGYAEVLYMEPLSPMSPSYHGIRGAKTYLL